MLREYRLTNFKAFGETVTIPIRPLTLIFGANSSGKSSIFQSMLLLKQTLEEAKNPETALLPKGAWLIWGRIVTSFIGMRQNEILSLGRDLIGGTPRAVRHERKIQSEKQSGPPIQPIQKKHAQRLSLVGISLRWR